MQIHIITLLTLSTAFLCGNVAALGSNCPEQTVVACKTGVGSDPITRIALNIAKESAENSRNQELMNQCELACKELPGTEAWKCIPPSRPKLLSKFPKKDTLTYSGPDTDDAGSPKVRTATVTPTTKSPLQAIISDANLTDLPRDSVAAFSCAAAECECREVKR
jgi:hypothetical protein